MALGLREALRVFINIAGFSVTLASLIFMGITFFDEAILGHGILWIEPNLLIARSELAATIFGLVFLFYKLGNWMEAKS